MSEPGVSEPGVSGRRTGSRKSRRRTVAVIGAGVSGLAAARALAGGPPVSEVGRAAAHLDDIDPPNGTTMSSRCTSGGLVGDGELEVLLIDASARPGGKVVTGSIGGSPVELGADQFLRRDPSAERLCRELGLGPLLKAPALDRAAVFSHGQLWPFPPGLVLGVPTDLDALAGNGAVSDDGIGRARLDSTSPGPLFTAADLGLEGGDDPGVERAAGELLRGRLGDEVVDRLIDPLLGGINAGGIDALSLGTVAPQIAQVLVGHHDIIGPLGQLGLARAASGEAAPLPPASPFLGVEDGIGQLVDRLIDDLRARGVRLRTGASVSGLSLDGEGSLVLSEGGDRVAVDGVVLAVPGPSLATIASGVAPAAADVLGQVPYASVGVVTLAYDPDRLRAREIPEGITGFVVPRVEGRLVTAVTFLSAKWPWMAAGGQTLIRVSVGRYRDGRALALPDRTLVSELREELRELAGIEADPVQVDVRRWVGGFPQYLPGHGARMTLLRRELGRVPNVTVAGALLGGIGIPACITSGERAAVELLASIG